MCLCDLRFEIVEANVIVVMPQPPLNWRYKRTYSHQKCQAPKTSKRTTTGVFCCFFLLTWKEVSCFDSVFFLFLPFFSLCVFVNVLFQEPQWIVFPLWLSRSWICTCCTGWWQRREAWWRSSTRNCGGRSPKDSTCLPQSPVQPSLSAHS